MESTGRFEKKFFKLLENMTAGAGGAFGDGPSTHDLYVPSEQGSGDQKSNTPDDSRIAKPIGAGKVQTRRGIAGGKRKKKKKKGVNYLTGEENEEEKKGLDTSWEDYKKLFNCKIEKEYG